MKYILFSIVLCILLGCSSQFNIVRITSDELSIIDSCKNYIPNTPLLKDWNKSTIKYNNIKYNQYYCIFPIYNKKNKNIGYYTFISKPYYSIIGRDSIVNGKIQFLTVIKKNKNE